MNRNWIAAFLPLLFCPAARPDGYPFDPDTQRVTVPSLRLKLTARQTQEVSATGTLTFSDEHLRFIRLHYPSATNRADVIAATFNDNHEGLTPEGVYCFWVAPDEVAVTLNERHPEGKSPFDPPANGTFPTDVELKDVPSRHIRLGPEGVIYFRGRAITFEQALGIIDEIARTPKPASEAGPGERCLYVVVPPPLAARDYSSQQEERRTPSQIYDALVTYGASKAISVGREW